VEAFSIRAEDSGSKEVIQPLTVRVGNRTLTVDGSPLPFKETGWENLSIREGFPPVVQADAHSLVVGLSARRYACHFLFVPLGVAGAVYFGTAAAFPDSRTWLIPLVGSTLPTWLLIILAALSFLWFLLFKLRAHLRILFGASRVRFDRATGLMTFGPVWSRQSWPLSDVIAVQLLSDNFSSDEECQEPPETTAIKYYQLNLVLDHMDRPRVNVARHLGDSWSRRAGKQLADFLGVPLVDQTAAAT
jgi:hypothetical protein